MPQTHQVDRWQVVVAVAVEESILVIMLVQVVVVDLVVKISELQVY
jgi:hypothetical protein